MNNSNSQALFDARGESLVGDDNWHFLVGDRNRELEQHLGRWPIAERTLSLWAEEHAKRVAYCSRHQIPYLSFVVPDRLQPLKCYLPKEVVEAGVLDGPSTNGCKVSDRIDGHYLELLEHYTRHKELLSQFYLKTDTHWSDLGALHFSNFLHELEPVFFSSRGAQDYLFEEVVFTGDICKNDSAPRKESVRHLISEPATIQKSLHPYSGRLTLARNSSGANRKLLIFGNSFITDALLQYLSEDFSEIVSVFSNSFDYHLAEVVGPDFVIYQTLERFTNIPPNDSVHMSAFERASYLCATGKRPATSSRIQNHPYNTLSEICLKVAANSPLADEDCEFLNLIALEPLYRYCAIMVYYLSGLKRCALQLVAEDLERNLNSISFIKFAQLLGAHKDVANISLLVSTRKSISESTCQ